MDPCLVREAPGAGDLLRHSGTRNDPHRVARFGAGRLQQLFGPLGVAGMGIVERAFQLAPQCSSINDLRQALSKEGYSRFDLQLEGLGIQRELRRLYNQGEGARKRGPKSR